MEQLYEKSDELVPAIGLMKRLARLSDSPREILLEGLGGLRSSSMLLALLAVAEQMSTECCCKVQRAPLREGRE